MYSKANQTIDPSRERTIDLGTRSSNTMHKVKLPNSIRFNGVTRSCTEEIAEGWKGNYEPLRGEARQCPHEKRGRQSDGHATRTE